MSILAGITTGASRNGIRMVVMGQEKMGKTTFVAGAPGALLVPCEVGFAGVSCAKTQMIQSLEELWQFNSEVMQAVQAGNFPFRSIAYDSMTAIERHIHEYVLKQDPLYKPNSPKKSVTMDSAHGGYGKAYNLSNDYMAGLLSQWDQMAVYGGLNILLTCHTFAAKQIDPMAGEFDSWDLLLHSPKNQKTYGKREMVTQWADIIGFLHDPIYISKANEKAVAIASSQGKGRVMGLNRTPSYTAGNRFGMTGELPIPQEQGWNHFAHALYNATRGTVDVYTR